MPPHGHVPRGCAQVSISFSKPNDGVEKIPAKSTGTPKGMQNTPKNRILIILVLNLHRNHQLPKDSDRETLVMWWCLRGISYEDYHTQSVSHTLHHRAWGEQLSTTAWETHSLTPLLCRVPAPTPCHREALGQGSLERSHSRSLEKMGLWKGQGNGA